MDPVHDPKVIEAFVAFLHGSKDGTAQELDAFCDEHADCAHELRELHRHWLYTKAVVARLRGQRRLQQIVAERLGPEHDTSVTLDPPPENVDSPSGSHRHLQRENAYSRYSTLREIAQGGMGIISKVWDEDLRRNLAMKVAKEGKRSSNGSGADERRLARFLEEAQITGQLAHPGVVPVHDLGIDDRGRVYYTMLYVKGHDLQYIFEMSERGKDGWNQTRVLSVLLRVCEAMAYAHSKRVIHRDLKPSNIMVGRYGQVYVMDWGLARVLGQTDRHDVRVKPADRSQTSIRTNRNQNETPDSESPLFTMDGDVLGTPSFMSPEQARGELEQIGTASDVYAVGAMLYYLLAGRRPYTPASGRLSPHGIWIAVMDGPPRPVAQIQPEAPAELVAICEKAMARRPENRYSSMEALSQDLRAYLEHRVVSAYETGTVAELRKWIGRNKALSAMGAAAVLLTITGLGTTSYVEAKGRRVAVTEQQKLARIAEGVRATDLISKEVELWPPDPRFEQEYRDWLAEAEALAAVASEAREIAENLPPGMESSDEVASLDPADARYRSLLLKLVDAIHPVEPGGELYASVQQRLAVASTLAERSSTGAEARAKWATAIGEIGDKDSPYRGLVIEPQLGLLPIGKDPDSGLWEFAHLQSGSVPTRDVQQRIVRSEDMALVFVLLPAGAFYMGAQRMHQDSNNYDPGATELEAPVTRVEVPPFFISKYEMTQSQWERTMGPQEFRYSDAPYSGLHPVESVTWQRCQRTCQRMGLTLPTETQWEYAARAGTPWAYWTGNEVRTLQGKENLLDESAMASNAELWDGTPNLPFNDRYPHTSPVGEFRANPFGLHDVLGNVEEWCRNWIQVQDWDGKLVRGSHGYAIRGGSFLSTAGLARVSHRWGGGKGETFTNMALGLRPARALER